MGMKYLKTLLLVFALLFIPVCGGGAQAFADGTLPEPRPLGRDFNTYQAPLDPERSLTETDSGDMTGVITLRQALALALMKNPELAAFSWEIRAKEAAIIQAGLLPNPELGAQLEEFAGSGERRGIDSAQSTLQIGQTILLGGKRDKRTRLATLERDLAGWDYEGKRLDVLTDVTKAFVDVLAAQDQLSLARELVAVARNVYESAAERVKVGKVAPLEETKASVELANAAIEQEKARRELAASRKRLSNLWGQATPTFEKADGSLAEIAAIPALDLIERLIAQNPDVARWANEMEQRSAALGPRKGQSDTRCDRQRRLAAIQGRRGKRRRCRDLHSPAPVRPEPGQYPGGTTKTSKGQAGSQNCRAEGPFRAERFISVSGLFLCDGYGTQRPGASIRSTGVLNCPGRLP